MRRWIFLGLPALLVLTSLPLQAEGTPRSPDDGGHYYPRADVPQIVEPFGAADPFPVHAPDGSHCSPEGCGGCVSKPLHPPPAHPKIFVDYLYWRPHRQGLDFAIVDPGVTDAIGGQLASVSLDRQSGVRGGIGYCFPTGWDLLFTYTNLHSNGASAVSGFVRATATHPMFNFDAESAVASANLEYDVFDLELGRYLWVDEMLQIRLFGGLRGAHMEEELQVRYDGLDFVGGLTASSIDFDGLGLRIGAEARWNLVFGWALFGRAATSLLTGQFETRLLEADAAGIIVNVTDNSKQAVPVTEAALGLSWQCRGWTIDAGYEFTNWFNMQERIVFHDDLNPASFSRRQGNLGLEGFFVRLTHDW